MHFSKSTKPLNAEQLDTSTEQNLLVVQKRTNFMEKKFSEGSSSLFFLHSFRGKTTEPNNKGQHIKGCPCYSMLIRQARALSFRALKLSKNEWFFPFFQKKRFENPQLTQLHLPCIAATCCAGPGVQRAEWLGCDVCVALDFVFFICCLCLVCFLYMLHV